MQIEDNNKVIATEASEILGVEINPEDIEDDTDWDEVAKQERMEAAGEC